MYRMNIKAIFIDIDNTLLEFDAFVRQFMKERFSELGYTGTDEEMYRTFDTINDMLWHRLEDGELTLEKLKEIRWSMVLSELGIAYDGSEMEEMFRADMHESTIITDGAMDMLKELSEHHALYTASNGPYDQQVHRIEKAGMAQYFKGHFISSDIGVSKPDVRFFEEAHRRMEAQGIFCTKDEMLVIGDSLTSDMEGGYRYGIHTCFFNRGNRDIRDQRVELCVTDLREIGKAIGE